MSELVYDWPDVEGNSPLYWRVRDMILSENPFRDPRSGLNAAVLHAVNVYAHDATAGLVAIDDEYQRCGNEPKKFRDCPGRSIRTLSLRSLTTAPNSR